jgi:hypothetical protein
MPKFTPGPSDIGKKHHKLLVLKEEMREHSEVWCYCLCDCGAKVWKMRSLLRRGVTKSCGKGSCRSVYESCVGGRFNKLVVLKEARRKPPKTQKDGKYHIYSLIYETTSE